MFGLIVSDPHQDAARRRALTELLYSLDIPLAGFTDAPAPLFSADMSRAAFLRTASAALLQPGQPVPLDALLTHLSVPEPLPGNVIRRYLFLQYSLLPYLRPGRSVTQGNGFFLLGNDLLVAPVSAEDTVDILLPSGVWTELSGTCHEGRLRCMRGYNEMPILARENALIPISINGQSLTQTTHDDADRMTLHWFQPKECAECILADGTTYRAQRTGERISICADTEKPFHLIIHQDGIETLVR